MGFKRRRLRRAAALAGILLALRVADTAQTEPRNVAIRTLELEVSLFVLNPPSGASFKGAVDVLWIPLPLQKYCLGKTREQCAAIDYCIRTTNRDVSQCRNLSLDVGKIPKYPRDIYPARLLAITYFPAVASIPGLSGLLEYRDRKPRTDFDRLSLKESFKARVRVKRSPDDDDFELLQVLALPNP
jgi:hypothetical protein